MLVEIHAGRAGEARLRDVAALSLPIGRVTSVAYYPCA